jgi:hypothetical protein
MLAGAAGHRIIKPDGKKNAGLMKLQLHSTQGLR